jgi:hypothetical protein
MAKKKGFDFALLEFSQKISHFDRTQPVVSSYFCARMQTERQQAPVSSRKDFPLDAANSLEA